jgi:hypothetical protein
MILTHSDVWLPCNNRGTVKQQLKHWRRCDWQHERRERAVRTTILAAAPTDVAGIV